MTKKITLISIVMLIIMFLSTCVQAYQATSKGTVIKDYPATWIKGIRNMEGAGRGLGLNEIINEESLLPSTDSNNIDVHMIKNTEYGAILILGISDYGKQGATIEARRMDKGQTTGTANQASTTGNKTGIYEMGYYDMSISQNSYDEWVAAGGSAFLSKVASRYIDRYTGEEKSAKDGDATVETKYWHGGRGYWLSANYYGFVRGGNGAFSYDERGSNYDYYARASVFVGVGL